jgi:hypothetical protein
VLSDKFVHVTDIWSGYQSDMTDINVFGYVCSIRGAGVVVSVIDRVSMF